MASRSPRPGAGSSDTADIGWTGWSRPEPDQDRVRPDREPLTAAELVEDVRRRLGLGDAFSDRDIEACIAAVMRQSEPRGRWLAAFSSALGRSLIAEGRDLNTTLRTLIALAPSARS